MRILYVCGTYVPASGGSEKSAHTLLRELVKRGYEVLVITSFGPDRGKRESKIDQVPVIRVSDDELENVLNKARIRFNPTVILTQLIWSNIVLKWAKYHRIPTAYFVRTVGGRLKLTNNHPFSPDIIFSNSENTRAFIKNEWHRDSIVVYPIVDFKDYIVKDRNPVYIVMFNPVKVKGGEIFKSIAKKMTGYKFMAVEGWHHLKDKKMGNWDMKKMKLMSDAYGESKVLVPEEVDLSGVKNIKYVKAVNDVRKIYKKTRILLLPSLWEEASARVIREAMINGIPVVASDTGGTREIVGRGGIIIKNFFNINNWICNIKKLDDSERYLQLSKRAKREALKFDYRKEVDKVESALRTFLKLNKK